MIFAAQNASLTTTTETAVAEGRYIKGDPLNGYYDFIITEGSYKFWVVFQVNNASLKSHLNHFLNGRLM